MEYLGVALDSLTLLASLAALSYAVRLSSSVATPLRAPAPAPADAASTRVAERFDAPPDGGEPSDERALRHRHRYGPKDADGVRLCRCGDRYLDGMVV